MKIENIHWRLCVLIPAISSDVDDGIRLLRLCPNVRSVTLAMNSEVVPSASDDMPPGERYAQKWKVFVDFMPLLPSRIHDITLELELPRHCNDLLYGVDTVLRGGEDALVANMKKRAPLLLRPSTRPCFDEYEEQVLKEKVFPRLSKASLLRF